MKLYKFYQDFRRSGHLDGLFFATEEEVTSAYGKTAYFGEVLGKHSDVWCVLNEGQFTVVLDETHADAIAALKATVEYDTLSGFNPLEYVNGDEED